MPVRVGWLVKDQIVVVESRGYITDEEFFELDKRGVEYLEASNQPKIHIIFDNRNLSHQPGFVTQTKAKVGKHEKLGMSIVVGASNPFIKFVSSAATQFLGVRLRFVEDLDVARDILESMLPDTAIPPYDEVEWIEYINWQPTDSPVN